MSRLTPDNRIFNDTGTTLADIIPRESFKELQRQLLQMKKMLSAAFSQVKFPLISVEVPKDALIIKAEDIKSMSSEGWTISWHLHPTSVRYIANSIRSQGSQTVEACMIDLYHSEDNRLFKNMKSDLLKSPLLQTIKPTLSQAMTAYRQRRFALAVHSLFPCIECAIITAYKNSPDYAPLKYCEQPRAKAVFSKIPTPEKDSIRHIMYESLDNTLDKLWEPLDFNCTEPLCLNRHWAMHGRYKYYRFDTQANALRLLVFLESIVGYLR